MMMSFDIDTLVTLAAGAEAFLVILIVWYSGLKPFKRANRSCRNKPSAPNAMGPDALSL